MVSFVLNMTVKDRKVFLSALKYRSTCEKLFSIRKFFTLNSVHVGENPFFDGVAVSHVEKIMVSFFLG